MTEQNREEAIKYIEAQLEYGYLDLGLNERDELKIVKEAIDVLKMVDKFNSVGCTSFAIIPTKEKPIKASFEGESEVKIIDCDHIEIKKELHGAEAERIINNIFGTTDIATYDCSDMSDEEIDRICKEKMNQNNYMSLEELERWAEYFNKQEGRKYPCSNQIVRCYIATDKDKAISFMKDKNIVDTKESKNWIEWTLDNGEKWIWRNLNESCRGYRFYKIVVDRYIDADIFRDIVLPCCASYCCSMKII